MFSVTNTFIGLAKALIDGASNDIEKMIEEKIEEMGKDLIRDVIKESPIGAGLEFAERLDAAFETRGASEFKMMRDAWLNTLQPASPHSGMMQRINNSFQKTALEYSRPTEGHWKWSRSRKEWLDDSWRHDWRSQPRDARGRWIPGRLNTIYLSTKLRKVRSKRRRFVRQNVKDYFRGD